MSPPTKAPSGPPYSTRPLGERQRNAAIAWAEESFNPYVTAESTWHPTVRAVWYKRLEEFAGEGLNKALVELRDLEDLEPEDDDAEAGDE